MWEEVTVDRDDLLQRVAEISRSGDFRSQLFTIQEMMAADRSALSHGTTRLLYYQGAGFELVIRLTYQPRRDRYTVCFGVNGNVTAKAAVDLLFSETEQIMQQQGLSELYGLQPKLINSALLQQIYDAGKQDPRIKDTLLADLPDFFVHRLTAQTAP